MVAWSILIGWRNVSGEPGWITAAEAQGRLRVRPQTLYSYVSRGRVQARPHPDDPRRSLYSEPDVERLALANRAVRRPAAVAASSIAWGEPMLSSAISTVHSGRLIYRGRDAVQLSRTTTLEQAAAILWNAANDPFAGMVSEPPPSSSGSDVMERLFAVIARLAASAPTTLGRPTAELTSEAAGLLNAMAVAVSEIRQHPGERMHAYLARSWSTPKAADPIRRALVLLADHELNVSTFAARVTASSGASLPACVLSGLCALTGPRHGRAGLQVGALVEAFAISGADALPAASGKLPGFGHPLYAGLDARAGALLASFEEPKAHVRARAWIAGRYGLAPNIDYALSALTARFRLPPNAPFIIFAVARAVGWMAHAIEQVEEGGLIRPRARYTGQLPGAIEVAQG